MVIKLYHPQTSHLKEVVAATRSRIREPNERTVVNNGRVTGPPTVLQGFSRPETVYKL